MAAQQANRILPNVPEQGVDRRGACRDDLDRHFSFVLRVFPLHMYPILLRSVDDSGYGAGDQPGWPSCFPLTRFWVGLPGQRLFAALGAGA